MTVLEVRQRVPLDGADYTERWALYAKTDSEKGEYGEVFYSYQELISRLEGLLEQAHRLREHPPTNPGDYRAGSYAVSE